jgi:hypothetical protein
MVDKIPASHRSGFDGQSAAARTKEYLSNLQSAGYLGQKIIFLRRCSEELQN